VKMIDYCLKVEYNEPKFGVCEFAASSDCSVLELLPIQSLFCKPPLLQNCYSLLKDYSGKLNLSQNRKQLVTLTFFRKEYR